MHRASTFSISPEALSEVGLPIEPLLSKAGVTRLDSLSTSEFFRLWLLAEEALNDASAGLRFGDQSVARGYGVASIVALQAPDLRHALKALSRYKRLTCPELVEVVLEGEEATVRYRWLEAAGEVPRLLVDMTMASLNAMVRHGTAGRAAPIRLELARRVDHAFILNEHFDCPVVLEAKHDAMVFDRAVLDVPFVTADGGAFGALLHGLEERLVAQKESDGLLSELRLAIARQLSEGRRPSLAAVASRLAMSSRTLQRRICEHDTSFQHQLDGVRHTTASRLLANTKLDTVVISMLLGFEEPNSFTRAFRSWERTTPAHWRERRVKPIELHAD